MVLIPAGEFLAGDDRHAVYLDAFYIDKTPVTNREYALFVEETRHRRPYGWQNRTYPEGKAEHPVTFVAWKDVVAYAEWSGKRVLLALEWEKAARGPSGWVYPWGNQYDSTRCNTRESQIMDTTPVGYYSPRGDSIYGVCDMAGNVWEWVADWHDEAGGKRTLCGGAWDNSKEFARGAFRLGGIEYYRYYYFAGFRCALDVANLMEMEKQSAD